MRLFGVQSNDGSKSDKYVGKLELSTALTWKAYIDEDNSKMITQQPRKQRQTHQ